MDSFAYAGERLHIEDVPLDEVAETFGTPCYVYSKAAIARQWLAFDEAFGDVDHLVCYAVKANSNLAVLALLARLGSGFDVVSEGELRRVMKAGGRPEKAVFAGVGKSGSELEFALDAGIGCINVESTSELDRVSHIADRIGLTAPVSLRVNPDVDAQTHPYISTGLKSNKFGIPIEEAPDLYQRGSGLPGICMVGVDCHIGSQLISLEPVAAALDRVLALVDGLREMGIELRHLNIGGGMGIRYREEVAPEPADLANIVERATAARGLKLLCEPGRSIVGNAGVLLTRVEYLKRNGDKHFAIVDAAMNDLLRPALYQAWHGVDLVDRVASAGVPQRCYDIVGPVCESADFLAKERALALVAGSLLAIRSAGAYGFGMSSNYNTRPRAAEVLVDGGQMHLVRAREEWEQLWAAESIPP